MHELIIWHLIFGPEVINIQRNMDALQIRYLITKMSYLIAKIKSSIAKIK